jgi:hypothetical protein
MKYFTVELLNRIRSDDDDVSARAHDEWESALKRYSGLEAQIKEGLPSAAQRFLDEHVCLHDARLLNLGRRVDTFVMVLEKEAASRDLVILMFILDGEPKIENTPLADKTDAAAITWMYEEWSRDRRGRPCFDAIWSNGWHLSLRLKDFNYVIVPQVFPKRDEQSGPFSLMELSRPA